MVRLLFVASSPWLVRVHVTDLMQDGVTRRSDLFHFVKRAMELKLASCRYRAA